MGKADAIVVGGGLAGAAFAIELARNGARVVLVERSRAAALKVCGDFLSAEALELLAHLGVDTVRLGVTSIERLTLAVGDRSAEARLPFRAGGLSRLRLDEELIGQAARAGVEIVRGSTVTGVGIGADHTLVATDVASHSAPVAALATGKHNLRGWPRTPGAVTGFKIQFAPSIAAQRELAARVRLTLVDGGYIGACLVEDNLLTICWQIDTDALRRTGPHWQTQLEAFSRESPWLGDLLSGAIPLSKRPAAASNLPFGYRRRAAVAPHVFAVGDQLAVIPAFTGDGTSIALASGIGAARSILSGERAAAFQARFIAALSGQFGLAGAVNAALQARTTRRLTVGAVRAVPLLATLMARATRLGAVARPILASQRSSTTK